MKVLIRWQRPIRPQLAGNRAGRRAIVAQSQVPVRTGRR